jgi:two-component system chemotaxis sensor kinase CheA
MEPALLLRDLACLGEVVETSLDFSHLPDLPVLDPESCYLSWTVVLQIHKIQDEMQDEIQEIFAFVEESSTLIIEALTAPVDEATHIDIAQPSPSAAVSRPANAIDSASRSHSPPPASIRVPTDRVDTLINLIGEAVITQSMISQVVSDFSADKLSQLQEVVLELERNIRELQERVMAIRMLPISSVFSRFPRTVRDLAASLHKEVVLQTFGEETELDKALLEGIGDPLTHLVRNAVDHGIEPLAERIALGKPEQDTIQLHAFHQGGKVSIEVRDDGRGLDTERIRHKAIAQGLISAEDILNEEQIHALIFAPGFSTTETVSDISGRGVGMDVVKQNIEALNGTVSVSSNSGQGVCFRLRLPLTLAILDGLSLCVGEQVYILPLVNIVESIRPHPESVKQLPGQGEVVLVRDACVPLLRLHSLFGIPAQASEPHHGLIIIIEQEGQHVAVFVDALLGQQQVVIKSLETNFRKTQGIAGATILGDGRVALILDVSELVTLAGRVHESKETHGLCP